MLIYRNSPVTGRINCMSIDVTQDQLNDWESGTLIQNAIPSHLSADEREFIMTGIMASEWDSLHD